MKCSSSDIPTALRSAAIEFSHPRGSYIFRTGTPSSGVFFVTCGEVRLMRRGRQGEEIVLHHARTGEFFAEASIDSARYHCDAIAVQPTTVLKVSAHKLVRLLAEDPQFAAQWVSLLSGQLRATRMRVERLSIKSAAERVRHLLVTNGTGPRCEVQVRGSLKDLASELGLSHEALYRTLSTMQRDGQIQRHGRELRLIR